MQLPLFASFLGDHVNAINNKTQTKYSKNYAKRQGQVLKKVTCKTDAEDVRAKVAAYLGHELPCFFVKEMTHDKLLSLMSVGERCSRGNYGRCDGCYDLSIDVSGEDAFDS